MKIEATTTATVTSAFQENSQPSCARRPSLAIIRGTPPSSVPAGQSHLQKAGVTTPLTMRKYSGRAMTITTSTMYFITVNRRVQALFLSFFVGILYRSSWMSPKGHKKAHTARPSSAPKSSSMPSR